MLLTDLKIQINAVVLLGEETGNFLGCKISAFTPENYVKSTHACGMPRNLHVNFTRKIASNGTHVVGTDGVRSFCLLDQDLPEAKNQ